MSRSSSRRTEQPLLFFLGGLVFCSLFGSEPALAKAPWFDDQDCKNPQKVTAQSRIDRYRYDASGKIVENLWSSDVATCILWLRICGDSIFRGKEINTKNNESCPENLNSQAYNGKRVCCEEWTKAKQTKKPCDPLTDIDCNGLANREDADPTTSSGTAEESPAPNKGGKTLRADLRVIIQAPHRFPLGVTPFALVVKNYGPNDAANVRLSGTAGLGKLNYASTSQGNCTVNGASLNCEFDSIPSGGSRSVSVQLRTEAEGEAHLAADVSGGAADPVTENNHAEQTITVNKAVKGTFVNP